MSDFDQQRQHRKLQLAAQCAIAEDAESFLRSNIGRYLLGLAEVEAKLAAKEFAATPLTDSAKLAVLQARIGRHHDLERWISEAITDGRQAGQELDMILTAEQEE